MYGFVCREILKYILLCCHIKSVDINGVTVRCWYWQAEWLETGTKEKNKCCSRADLEARALLLQRGGDNSRQEKNKHFLVRVICLQEASFQAFSLQLCRSRLFISRHIVTSDVSFQSARRSGVVFIYSFFLSSVIL